MREKDYDPFGDEWKAEMMKMRKADIIEFYRKALLFIEGVKHAKGVSSPIVDNTTTPPKR